MMLQVIALLLFLILTVMLFGADAVKDGLGNLAIIGVLLAIMLALFSIVREVFRSVQTGVREAQEKGHAWLWKYVMAIGVGWLSCVYIYAGLTAGTLKGAAFSRALNVIPYWWGGAGLIGAAILLRIIESASRWIPKIPTFFFQVGLLLAGPVILPRVRWSELEMARREGNHVGAIRTGWELSKQVLLGLYTFLLGLLALGVLFGIGTLAFMGVTGQL